MKEMIDTHARIQINRDSLRKIVKLTAESKLDKIRIKEQSKLITDMMEWLFNNYESSILEDRKRDDLIQRAKDIKDR